MKNDGRRKIDGNVLRLKIVLLVGTVSKAGAQIVVIVMKNMGSLKAMTGIRLSKKYGVNPAIPLCYFCNEPKNEIILAGKLSECGDIEAPKAAVWDMNPCDGCSKFMEKGILLISVRDGEQGGVNPYRTGRAIVVTEGAIKDMIIPGEFLDSVLKRRFCFVSDTIWNKYFPVELAVTGGFFEESNLNFFLKQVGGKKT